LEIGSGSVNAQELILEDKFGCIQERP